ncbi:ATP-binding protein [Sulfuricurvum sp.]|uniref:ATP-binding protein n=1 Tax=Sulfuricurvum sp. TaxID=2025608 RepID=UPI003C5FED7B
MIHTDNDLNECDKEPIHIPSAIQPHGFFLAIDPANENIVAASSNIDHFFALSTEDIIGQPLSAFSLLMSQWVQEQHKVPSPLPAILFLTKSHDTTRFIVSLHRNASCLILEAEPAMNPDLFPDYLAQSVINEAIILTSASSTEALCHLGALALQRLSGFGRVMAYRFDDEYNGSVIAEAKIPEMEAYLDHHFPASDIPVQARELYRTNLIRYIPDATYTPVPLKSLLPYPIDMSQSSLRSVSPIHLEYLRNMGIASSMSLSIIVEGKLWGLFACHHSCPLPLAYTIRRYCEMFIRIFNALIQEKIANEASQTFFRLKDRYSTLKHAFQTLCDHASIHESFSALGEVWMDALESDGVCLFQNDEISVYGTVPETSQIKALSEQIDPMHENDLYASGSIGAVLNGTPFPEAISGVLSIIITHHPRTEIIWFRREWVRTLKWAGHPDKAATIDPTQRISPRKSFETFTQEQRGKSIPWSDSHLLAAELYKELGPMIELEITNRAMKCQNQLLIQQGKMAMMGEMIGAIAHQWNQPLNALSLLISGLSELIDETNINPKSLREIKQIGMEQIRFMSETIDAFRNFFQPEQNPTPFSITQSIQEVHDQLLPHVKLHNIDLILSEETGTLHGSPNAFKQVILILLSNAYDALIGNEIENPWIECRVEHLPNTLQLHICDNAGGISPEHLNQLFTPYFSTKEKGVGRGIGLYLAKLIIEEQFGGTITLQNKDKGACFTLTFKE